MEKIKDLLSKWEKDIKTYPSGMPGDFCRTVLRCCIRELKEVYDDLEEAHLKGRPEG